jgi:hypothetical protein
LVAPPISDAELGQRWKHYSMLTASNLPLFRGGEIVATQVHHGAWDVTRGNPRKWLYDYLGPLANKAERWRSPFLGRALIEHRIYVALSYLLPTRTNDIWSQFLAISWCSIYVLVVLLIAVALFNQSNTVACVIWVAMSTYFIGWLIGKYELMKLRMGY